MASVKEFKEEIHNDWCPGCGDFGILNATQMALADMELEPSNVSIFSGVGCSGKTPHYIRTYGIHTLHGRVLPFAVGAKLTKPDMTVMAVGGDGDGYGIGAGHFMAAGRRNVDVTYCVMNNGVYGLTKGQASPTLKLGEQTKSLPLPNINAGVNPLALAIGAGYTFVARAYAFDIRHLKSLIAEAVEHKGTALIDVLQPCPTYNNVHTKEFWGGDNDQGLPRLYKLEDEGYDGTVPEGADIEVLEEKMSDAISMTFPKQGRHGLGVLYKARLPTFEERLQERSPAYPNSYPADGSWVDDRGLPTGSVVPMMKELLVQRDE